MIDRIGPVIADLNDSVDELEEEVLEVPGHELRTKLSKIRRQAISLRRFIAPLRDVLTRLYTDRTPLFDDMSRSHLREIAERLTRYIEELDSARDRVCITLAVVAVAVLWLFRRFRIL